MGAHASAARLTVSETGPLVRIAGSGDWLIATVGEIDDALRALKPRTGGARLVVDLGNVERMDTAGAWLVSRVTRSWEAQGGKAEIVDPPAAFGKRLRSAVGRLEIAPPAPARSKAGFGSVVDGLGARLRGFGAEILLVLDMLGAAIRGPQLKNGVKGAFRPTSIIHHIDRMGLRAVPIVALMSFLVGGIIAQQGAWSLRYFGAEFLAVDLVGILLLREVGVLLTAVMVAGRSGSAMTAEIGSMKMREEVDALTVIGLNPIGVLILPRLIALMIALPLLVFIADLAALAGSAVLLALYSDIGPTLFLAKLRDAISAKTLLVGLVKTPFMALMIGLMAAVEGMRVEGSAESLGRHVTAAVVKSIFLVILIDGLFAVFYAQIDV